MPYLQKKVWMSNKLPFVIIIFIFCCGIRQSSGQIVFKSITESLHYQNSGARTASNVRDSTRISLPFWDDFSRTNYHPDTTHWFADPGTAVISSTIGANAPTINMATFDGWNNMGVPYSSNSLLQGAGDSLVSRFIDLSQINPALYPTCYISFFWQKQGRGEIPDEMDSIRLQFIDANKIWRTVWRKTGAGISETNTFQPEILQISNPSFFHTYSQFRFQSFGRLSGGYDTWNIDYVYLNLNRNAGDMAFEDRAMASMPSSWISTYYAMPYDHFLLSLETLLQTTSVQISNMDSQVQPVEFFAQIRDSTRILDEMNQGTPINLAPKSIVNVVSEAINPAAFDPEADTLSLILQTKTYINSGDSANWLNKYDLRANDTTYNQILLDKDLAYDDGTAEWAAGLSQQAAMLAYRFVIPKPDVITSVKFYFPEFSPSAAGKSFTLIIWDDINKYRQGRLLTEQHIVQQSTRLNEFTIYTLGRPVAVLDTFYVGYEQLIPDFFAVGLDKNGNFIPGNVFINLDGVWEQADNVEGNFMIRPVFGFEAAVGFEEELFRDIKIFPNPAQDRFNIYGAIEEAVIFDLLGNEIMRLQDSMQEREVRISSGKGLYLLKIRKEGKYKTFKLVIQ